MVWCHSREPWKNTQVSRLDSRTKQEKTTGMKPVVFPGAPSTRVALTGICRKRQSSAIQRQLMP